MSNDAPRLPTTTILELSQSSAVVKENGDYTVQFPEPVTINEGDQLNIKMVSIDSQDADSESIVLPLDGVTGTGSTALSLGFSFYDVNYDLENGYSADNKVIRKKYDPATIGAGSAYPIDCEPYQPYGSIQESQLEEVTVVWTKKYTNGHSQGKGHAGQFREQLNGFNVKLGFTWYEPANDGGSIYRTSDIKAGTFIFAGSTDYTSGEFEKKKNRPKSIPVGTTQACTLASGPPIRFKKGSLQVHSITVEVRNTDNRYPDVTIADGNSFLAFQSQRDKPNNPLLPVTDNGLTFTSGGANFTVALESSPTGILKNGDVYALTGVVGGPNNVQGIPINTLNREHVLVSHTTADPPVLTFAIQSSSTATAGTGGGAGMNLQKAGRVELIQGTQTIEIPNGRYDRQSMAAAITEGFSQVFLGTDENRFLPAVHFEPRTNLQFKTQTSEYGSIRFRKMEQFAASGDAIGFDDANSYTYDRSGGSTNEDPVDMLIGARKFSMTYGRNGDIYQWDNGHTSVANPATIDPSGSGVPTDSETVGYYQIAANKFCQVNAATGIIINDMEPRQFWDDMLGLYNNCVVPLQTGTDAESLDIAYVGSNALVNNVPKGSSQLQSFTPLNSRYPLSSGAGVPTLTVPVYTDVASVPTNPVLGETPVVIGAGYYLVEIKSLNLSQSNFIDEQENRGHISAIVSTQYNANDSITGFADAGIPYVHRGAPQLISSANVRILDPDTKQVPINLGSRNTVFLQVDSTAPVYMGTPSKAKNMNAPTQNQLQGM